MNKFNSDVLIQLYKTPLLTQRQLASSCNISLGTVNNSLNELKELNLIHQDNSLTQEGVKFLRNNKPKRAIILAAGYGLRMVPINMESPKGLLQVKNEVIIERLIRQLHEVGITEIHIVVGFLKERFEYLIDLYGVELHVNPHYRDTLNLHSLAIVKDYIEDAYIVPSDIWSRHNPFNNVELYSWYLVTDKISPKSNVSPNRKGELVPSLLEGNSMLGIAFLTQSHASFLREALEESVSHKQYKDAYWEELLFSYHKRIYARLLPQRDIVDINTYEQLRLIDDHSENLSNEAIATISKVFNIPEGEINHIEVMKKGMTNRSFLFQVHDNTYIMRIPGEGTDQLINRKQEAHVYNTIADYNLSDHTLYLNPETGFKISQFISQARVCNPLDAMDVDACMKKLRDFHSLKLHVNHEFDLIKEINFYESLWGKNSSMYSDYQKTKEQVLSLQYLIDTPLSDKVLCHIDAVPDNFLLIDNRNIVKMIDWEYAAMQDPLVDIAMFAIYSLYNRSQIDNLISSYFQNDPTVDMKIRIYAYIATCGLLWSNWCEYKYLLGVEFGEYSLRQYRYAKDFYRIVQQELQAKDQQ
ncbi:MAG: phosphotransferase [Sphaerochaetaceae bacterium]